MIRIILLILFLILFISEKFKCYVMALWMAEKDYPMPNKDETEILSKKIVAKLFHKN